MTKYARVKTFVVECSCCSMDFEPDVVMDIYYQPYSDYMEQPSGIAETRCPNCKETLKIDFD